MNVGTDTKKSEILKNTTDVKSTILYTVNRTYTYGLVYAIF